MPQDTHDGLRGTIDKVMDKAGGMLGKAKAQNVTDPETFVEEASVSGLYEIKSSELALERANSEDVKTLAERMINDHKQASRELNQTLETHPGDLEPANELDNRRQGMLDHLRATPEDHFDARYLEQQDDIVVLAEAPDRPQVRYIHGTLGQGTFTFYSGHDPEDYQHFVGDPPTDLSLHPNSPGYRLILNNILFPAAKKKKQKT